MLHPILNAQLPLVAKLFKEHRIKSAYAFGSVVGNNFTEESDIDFLINFEDDVDELESGKIWWQLHDNLREVLNREIDLLVETSLKNPYFIADINKKKQMIYAA